MYGIGGEALEQEFDAAFRKIFFKLEDQVDSTVAALNAMNQDKLRDIWAGDRAINRFCNFCMRIINKRGSIDPVKMTHLYSALVQLEEFGDMLYLIGLDVIKYGVKKVHPEIISIVADLKTAIRQYAQYFYTHDDRCSAEILRLRDVVYEAEGRHRRDVGNAMLLKRAEFAYDMLVSSMDCAISTTPTLGASREGFK